MVKFIVMKKRFILLIFVILIVVITLFSIIFVVNKSSINSENLIFSKKHFKYGGHVEKKLKAILHEKKDFKINPNERINRFYAFEKFTGRIKTGGISYNSIFAIDKSEISIKIKNINVDRLSFSIFNSGNSRLFYRIFVLNGKTEKLIYTKFMSKRKIISKTINIKNIPVKGSYLILRTKGRGFGAWINPFLFKYNKKPRVFIVIMLDTLRADHTSLYGYNRNTTPCLKKLASDGVLFKNAYSTTSWTLPAHVALFTGKNLIEHRVMNPNTRISYDYPLIAELFQKNGFTTIAFTGGGFVEDDYGFFRGFQYYSNIPGNVFSMNSGERVFQHFKNHAEINWGKDMFVFLHTYQLHAPYKVTHKYLRSFNKALDENLKGIRNYLMSSSDYFKNIGTENRKKLIDIYDSSILYLDNELVGRVVDFLKSKNVYKKSMIVVLSDHGEEFYDHSSWEHGHTLYRELIKIPLVIKYPENKKRGVENRLSSIMDIPSIILENTGFKNRENFPYSKIETNDRVLPVLLPVSPIIKQFPAKISFIDQKYHFIFNILDKKELDYFTEKPDFSHIELYKNSDIKELNNLFGKDKKPLARFMKLLNKYRMRLNKLKLKQTDINSELKRKLKSLGYLN